MKISRNKMIIAGLTAFVCGIAVLNSCKKDDLKAIPNRTISFMPKISDYHIFNGDPKKMVPEAGFHLYTLASTLFSDYAEKQRLIKLPAGTQMTRIDNGLPSFPDGTMIVKTFFYYNDKRDTTRGKHMIETRLLIKQAGSWNVSSYQWNEAQTEAFLLQSGTNINVAWITEKGEHIVTDYHVPSVRECATCHNSDDQIIPIGPKLRNLNFDVPHNGQTANQLSYFQSIGLLNDFDPHQVSSAPQAFNNNFTLEQQARAYLDINCAHCHNGAGDAKKTGLFMSYDIPFDQTGINKQKDKIVSKMQKGEMPLLGTTVLHAEGIQLIRDYINTLK